MKCYYSISEVSKKTNVKPYVLRYWEQEFKELQPKKTKGGRRKYTSQHIDLIFLIKKLLYEDHYTIEGARERLNSKIINQNAKIKDGILNEVAQGLKEILDILKI